MAQLQSIPYTHAGTALTGQIALPSGPARAAVVVFPTIMNPAPATERRAQMLADAGYVALLADFYGERPASPDASRPLAEALRADVDHYRARCLAALDALRAHPAAEALPVAAIGFCMGGQAALECARAGADLVLAASFHGILTTDRRATAPIKPKLLICHGDADPLAPRTDVLALWEEFDAVGANWHFHSYGGVKHGFTDPGSDARGMAALGYDASADRQSWAALLALLDEVVG